MIELTVLVTVGTHEKGFERLLEAVDEVLADRHDVDCFVQYGSSRPPKLFAGAAFLAPQELQARLGHSDVLISQASPGMANEALRQGCFPIMMPRRAALREAVDDHQAEFALYLAAQRAGALADSSDQLANALASFEGDRDMYRRGMQAYLRFADRSRSEHAEAVARLLRPEALLPYQNRGPIMRRWPALHW